MYPWNPSALRSLEVSIYAQILIFTLRAQGLHVLHVQKHSTADLAKKKKQKKHCQPNQQAPYRTVLPCN